MADLKESEVVRTSRVMLNKKFQNKMVSEESIGDSSGQAGLGGMQWSKNPLQSFKTNGADTSLHSKSSHSVNKYFGRRNDTAEDVARTRFSSCENGINSRRPLSDRPKTRLAVAPHQGMSLRTKEGVPLKIHPFDSALYHKFKAMQIQNLDPRQIVAAMESEGLDPHVLYPQLNSQRRPDDPIEDSSNTDWKEKYSKRYHEYYYQNQRTGEMLWKSDIEKLLGETAAPSNLPPPVPPKKMSVQLNDDDF